MAITQTPIAGPFRSTLSEESGATNSVVKNIKLGPTRLRAITINNTSAQLVHYKAYDDKNPTLGSTDPDLILPVPASTKLPYTFDNRTADSSGAAEGLDFTTAYSYACVQEPGTPGTTAPSSTVTVSHDFEPAI